jgi:hypothetical protein
MPLPQRHQDFQVLVLQVANFGFGSTADQQPVQLAGLLSGVKQTKSAGKQTSIVTASSLLNRRTMPA